MKGISIARDLLSRSLFGHLSIRSLIPAYGVSKRNILRHRMYNIQAKWYNTLTK